jgi:hypothetical protein
MPDLGPCFPVPRHRRLRNDYSLTTSLSSARNLNDIWMFTVSVVNHVIPASDSLAMQEPCRKMPNRDWAFAHTSRVLVISPLLEGVVDPFLTD